MPDSSEFTLSKLLVDLESKRSRLASELKRVEEQIGVVRNALGVYSEHYQVDPKSLNTDPSETDRFRDGSIREVLIRMAQETDGVISTKVAKEKLVAAGRFEDIRTAASGIAPILSRKELFERKDRGVYKYIGYGQADRY
jgi:hypothetical protein